MKQFCHFSGKTRLALAALTAGLLLFCACGNSGKASGTVTGEADSMASGAPRLIETKLPVASGTAVYEGAGVTLDASNTAEGYVMVKSAGGDKRQKARVAHDETAYHYDQPRDEAYETYPLQMGSGDYEVQVLEQVEGTMYARIFAEDLSVELSSEFAPYLYPNQFVSYSESDESVLKAAELAAGLTDEEKIADKFYRYVADTVDYDYDKAATVGAGYLPVPDETLKTCKGICFDYSALLATMLRAQGIPTKLVIGHVAPDDLYHAWNLAFVNGRWKFYDATLANEGRKESSYTGEREY